MPFLGKDWRDPGEQWIRIDPAAGFWERTKLRPLQMNSGNTLMMSASSASMPIPGSNHLDSDQLLSDVPSPLKRIKSSSGSPPAKCAALEEPELDRLLDCLDEQESSEEGSPPPLSENSAEESASEDSTTEPECWEQPHCFVKLKNREFIGCTSMSEAFLRLDLARAVRDIRRANYIFKVVQILVNEKLQNLSAMSRKNLFEIIQAIVWHSVEADVHISTARDILNTFSSGLDSPHVCGSPQLAQRQLDTCSSLLNLIANMPPFTLSEANSDSITFLDLPKEVLRQILAKLPDHVSMLEVAKANETFQALVDGEQKQWRTLCHFHFTQAQIDKHQGPDVTWRQLFFVLKKYYGLKEVYADLIHICCHCKALFWKDHGHPCVSKDTAAPSVRVTPQQFVDMLLFL